MELYRVDYTLLGSTTKNCMKVLPSTGAPNVTQKIVVGDQEGITQIFSLKRGAIQIVFKSLPTLPVTNVVLGGSFGTIQDKIFISSGNVIHGYTKKGKLFLNFETQLLEPIRNIFVCGNDLIVAGIHNYHHYSDCKLKDTYTCRDVINDIITLNVAKVRRLTAVLACADHVLRTLDGSTITQSLILPNSPTCLHLMNGDGGTTGDHVLVGMQEGQIYLVQITGSSSTIIKWILDSETHKSEITCMDMFDLLKSGMPDIILGRHDGSIEVYTMIPSDEITNEFKPPIEKFCYTCNESITAVQGGYVGNSNFEEIIVNTHTGWVFALTTEVPEKELTTDLTDFSYGFSREEREKVIKLKHEIEDIECIIQKERKRYVALSHSNSCGISRLPYLVIKDKIILQKEDATNCIILESETSIDNILIQSDVIIKLLEVDKNSSVVSYSKCEPGSGNSILVTHRCQLNTIRFELRYFVDEGVKGTLKAYVIPQIEPKFCQLKRFHIKPLSLHSRIHDAGKYRYYNILNLKGIFSIAEMHSWIYQCLPELPEKPPDEDQIMYMFKSTLVDTILKCSYSRGEATFQSDNISTIAILKDVISKEATNKKIKLDISTTVEHRSITSTMQFLDAKLGKYFEVQEQNTLLEALRDIDTAQTEVIQNFLICEYKLIIENEKQIIHQLKERPLYLERLQNAVISLFVDWHKFKGINIKPKLVSFTNTLKNHYNYADIIEYFSLL